MPPTFNPRALLSLGLVLLVAAPAAGYTTLTIGAPSPNNPGGAFGVTDSIDDEPNDTCESATEWPVGQAGASAGMLGDGMGAQGQRDVEDWSKMLLFKTESLSATATIDGTTSLPTLHGPRCEELFDTYAAETGAYHIRVKNPPHEGALAYSIQYTIFPHDANGAEVSGEYRGAHPIVATQANQVRPIPLEGAVPNRNGQLDHDWFQIEAPGAIETSPIELAGIVTVTFWPECIGSGRFTLDLYEADGATRLASDGGCGFLKTSCISVGPTWLYADAAVAEGIGGAYVFDATFDPLDFLTLQPTNAPGYAAYALSSASRGQFRDAAQGSEEVARTARLEQGTLPWCSSTAPVLLNLMATLPEDPYNLLPDEAPSAEKVRGDVDARRDALEQDVVQFLP